MSHEAAISEFTDLIKTITHEIQAKSLNEDLNDALNAQFGTSTKMYEDLFAQCKKGVSEGWLCNREHGGIKFGRIIKPGADTHGFSVDVVEMDDCAGPYHAHPNGEIDLIMPIDEEAAFDDHGSGWLVYGPGSEHSPTVRGGKALVLYLLPEGAIDFKQPA